MDDPQTCLDLAVEQHKAGNLDLAEPLYRKVLTQDPHHVDALYLLGTLLLQKGKYTDCVAALEPLSKIRSDVADIHNNLGIAYHALGQCEAATASFQQAIRVRPDYDQAHFNLGILLEQQGQLPEAEQSYRQALEIDPDDAQVLCNLGFVLKAQERWDDADDCYSKLLNLQPENVEAAVNLGYVLVKQNRLTAAEQLFRHVLIRRPDYAEICNNLSYIYERQGRLAEAVAHAERAISLKPDYAEGYNNLGTALRSQRRLDEASAAFRRATELRPNFYLAEFNYGTTRLLAGDYLGGWAGYERREMIQDTPPRPFVAPRWNGEPMPGKTLLIYADQGFGDTIQFVRYLPRVKHVSGARLILECQPELKRLLDGFPGVDGFTSATDAPPRCEAEFPLLGLPAFFRTTLDDIPSEIPYLRADPALQREWGQRLAQAAPEPFRVGIVWQGNPQHGRDNNRSCRLSWFAPLSEVSGVALVSLQKDPLAVQQLARSGDAGRIVELGSQLKDFADSAALISQLDLVISVDTAVAHLAGALGQRTWTLLAYSGDWRWLLDRADNPWYPGLRVFRQSTSGDWDGIFREVTTELKRLVTQSID